MNYLALDIGERRTGVAFCDSESAVPVALETLKHQSFNELLSFIEVIAQDKSVDKLILGLPLLLDGSEGAQVEKVKEFAGMLETSGFPYEFIDERYSSTRDKGSDKDVSASLAILNTYLDRISS